MTSVLNQEVVFEYDSEATESRYRFVNPELPQKRVAYGSYSKESNVNFKLDPEDKKLWLDALRNGDFQQGNGALAEKRGNTIYYCCLGVLCEIKQVQKVDTGSTSNIRYGTSMDESSASYLPDYMESVLPTEYQKALAQMNDAGFTFEEIAQVIEVCL